MTNLLAAANCCPAARLVSVCEVTRSLYGVVSLAFDAGKARSFLIAHGGTPGSAEFDDAMDHLEWIVERA